MEMEGSGSTSVMPTENTSADNSDAESGDTIMTDIDDSGQDNLPTVPSANPSASKQKDGSSDSDIKEVSTAENTLSLTGAAGSIVSSESSSLSDLSDPNPAVDFKAKKLFFQVYSSEAPDGSETAHSVIRSLISAASGSSSTTLSIFEAIFKSTRGSDYLFYVTEILAKDCIPDKPEAVLVDLLTNLNNFVHFVKEEYLEKVKTHEYSVEHFTTLLKMQEERRRVELKGIVQSNSFPKKGMLLFNIATHFYLLLVQEIVSLKDLPDCEESRSFIKEVTDLLKSCAEFVLRSFNTHWKARLEGISYVSIRKKSLVDKGKSLKRKHADSQKYELSAIIMDNYCLTGERVKLHQTECDYESVEAESSDLLTLANSLRDDYIIAKKY
ncbi:hypothetical protein EB796_000766 [Bugula neritina]|uniref:Uncharacterized protein n=1 Tax=Bugula neritina TaxID=10212 RepID=A0A7J7KS43_BUGNE|nr:hypothetical protein EB796_000766 [Bugula neritina]